MSETNRTQRANALLLFLSAIICFSFASTDPIKNKQYKLIFHQFLDSETDAASLRLATSQSNPAHQHRFEPSFYPDTLTRFIDSTGIGESIFKSNGRYIIRSVESSFYGTPGFLYKYTRDMFNADYPTDDFVREFKKEFGLSPFAEIRFTAKKEAWYFWSGSAVVRAFNRYYGGPDNRFQHVTYGFMYKVAAKKYMTDYVKLIKHILVDKKEEWLSLCSDYKEKALHDSTFDGSMASYHATEKLLTSKDLQSLKVIPVNYLYIPIGQLMRRQIDGSLPSIVECLRVFLKDYDPENYQLLQAI
ncbi:MAG: hypothetical protein ACK5CC_05080 [Bacteroidota bacterium]